MKTKTTTIRLTDLDQERIENMKNYLAKCWLCDPNEITTTEIISAALGMYNQIKYEWNIDYAKLAQDVKKNNCIYTT